jgi:hypothetical protein
LCIAQKAATDAEENFESRAFPQVFLNHLETPAPYPDSSGLPGSGQAPKSVCEQRLS